MTAPSAFLAGSALVGIAASRTPSPAKARLRSLISHLVFGLGLYLAAEAGSQAGLFQAAWGVLP